MTELFPGAFHFPSISSFLQEELYHIYAGMTDEMYIPRLKSGNYMNLKMNCRGKHWNAIDYKYYDHRVDVDCEPVKPIPSELIRIATEFSLAAFPYHIPDWDICIINYYSQGSTLGMHADNSESYAALDIGHPVVSLSIGASSVFRVGGLTKNGSTIDVTLKSGEVFVLGGEGRLRYHGIINLFPPDESTPFVKELDCGRVNFTLRKY